MVAVGNPPANLDAERQVIGTLLLDRDAIIAIAPLLEPADFAAPAHAHAYAAIRALYDRRIPPDIMTVAAELAQRGQLDAVGRLPGLADLAAAVVTTVHAGYYAQIIARAAEQRRLVAAGTRIVGIGLRPDYDSAAATADAEDALRAVAGARAGTGPVLLSTALERYFADLDGLRARAGQIVGVPTGFVDLDRLTGGLQKSDLIIVAGRPAMGKTSLALLIAHTAGFRGKRVAIFSLEMPVVQIAQRFIALESGIDAQRLRLGQIGDGEWERLSRALGRLGEIPVSIDDTPGLTVGDIATTARRMAAQDGLDLIIVDYLQLMRGPRASAHRQENRQQEVAAMSRDLKALARDLDVPVLALSQLSRALEQRSSRVPLLSDLRESGALEQDADVVVLIHRPDLYDAEAEQGIAELHIAKHRNGPVGVVSLRFFAATTRFADLELFREEPEGEELWSA